MDAKNPRPPPITLADTASSVDPTNASGEDMAVTKTPAAIWAKPKSARRTPKLLTWERMGARAIGQKADAEAKGYLKGELVHRR